MMQEEYNQNCVDCGRDTSAGSGLWVNRVPADDGYLCPDCQSMECEVCGEISLDWSFPDGHTLTCDDCMEDN